MKPLSFILAVMLAVFLPLTLRAETEDSMEPGPGPAPGMPQVPPPQRGEGRAPGDSMDKKERFRDRVPPEIRERFEAARAKALQDPAIQELRKKAETAGEEFRKAMREAMMKADPGLAEIIKEKGKERGGFAGKPPGGGMDRWLAGLSDADKSKLSAAREKAKSDPAVQAAKQKMESAGEPKDRFQAMMEFKKAMHDALIKADPSLEAVFEKMKGQRPEKPQPGE